MKFTKIAIITVIGIVSLSGCTSEKRTTQKQRVAHTIEIRFDIPQLLKQNIEQVKEKLGEPKSEFIPSELQQKLFPDEIVPTIEYKKGTTSIQIDYLFTGEIRAIFISDETEGRTKEEILKLGNLNPGSSKYRIRVQEWISPDYARSLKAAEIAGIEVVPF